jgi:drug/metabolite transporter (DMT)-like permease
MSKKNWIIILISASFVFVTSILLLGYNITPETHPILGNIIVALFVLSLFFTVIYFAYIYTAKPLDDELKKAGWDKLENSDRVKFTFEVILVGVIVIGSTIYIKERFFGNGVGWGTFLGTAFLVTFIIFYVNYSLAPRIKKKLREK